MKGLLDNRLGHKYEHECKIMYEFHCDDHIEFQKHCNTLPYGGYLSIQKDPLTKPLLVLGQDECIFKQYVFSQRLWILPN